VPVVEAEHAGGEFFAALEDDRFETRKRRRIDLVGGEYDRVARNRAGDRPQRRDVGCQTHFGDVVTVGSRDVRKSVATEIVPALSDADEGSLPGE
jgi:hypothetical protein